MIRCLPEEVQTSLRSGVAINSVGHCVEELILNSIDAKATCIAIRVDLETFKVQVVDNGCGMGREDLNNVGNRYFTSKCYSLEDLENLKFYGFRGEALASIASMASILEILSRTSRTAKTFLKLFHNGKGLEVSEAELNRPSLGTTVTVYNLYHQLPVRRKCMNFTLEFERLRHKVEALSLVHPSVSFSLRNEAFCSMVLQLPKTKDMCTRFSQIYGLGKSQKLREINYRSAGFEIMGFISSEGHYNKNIQFLYVNNRLILKTKLHKLIAFLLRKQSVICKTKTGSLLSSPVRHRSGSELHGVFIINVKCQHDEYDICLEPAKTLIEFRRWNALLTCLEEGVKAFLKQEHLFIELCGEDITDFNENNDFCLGNPTALQSSLPKEKNIQETFKSACDNIVESYETFNLQSKSVRRKATLTKKIQDDIQPINNVKEVGVYSDVTGFESVHELRSNKDKYLLPNKKDINSDFLKFSKFPEESELHIDVMSSKWPEELGIQDKILETDQHSDTLLCTENHGKKDANSQQDTVIQERSPDLDNMGCNENEKHDECKSKYIFGHSMMGKCKLGKKGRESFTDLNIARGLMVEQDPLKLGSENITAYLLQNQPSYKTIESSNLLNRQAKLGPVTAKDIFEKQLEFSEQIPSSLENMTKTNIIHIGNTKEWLKKKSISASLPADSTTHSVISHVKEYMPVVPADSVIHLDDINSRRQINDISVRAQYCDSTKLSCHSKLGSLDRFRKYYGNLKRNASIKDTEIRNSDEAAVCSGSMAGDRTDLQNICETPTKEYIESNNNNGCNSLLPLEKSQHSPEENLSIRKAFSSNTITEYSQKVRKSLSGSNCTRTLASKVSRMKECDKDVIRMQPIDKSSAQTEVCSDPTDKNIQHLTSITHLQNTYKKSQHCPSIREEEEESNCFASASDKQGNSMGARADMEGTVSHCFIDTDGEYTISQNRHSVLYNKVDTDSSCEDASIEGEFTKQASKCNELQSINVPGNMEKNTEDSCMSEKPKFSPSKWFYKFDVSLGRMVFINKMSGLSSYIAPPEETSVACTQDLSTIAVNVIEKGFQCRCHPFRSEVIVPFLPKAQKERSLESQDYRDAQGESLQGLLSEWANPVFAQCPEVALDVSSGQADTLAVKIHNILYPYRFTKKMIDSLQVLNQVDNKFIACLINTREDESEHADGNLLVLVDQHAAHERVRLEQLITDSYDKQHEALGKKKLLASTLCPPLEIEVTEDQRRLLWCCHKNLENLGLELLFPKNNLSQILVGKVPLCFVEKEANELRRGRHTVTKRIVQELIQEQIELLQTTGGAQATLPLTILKVLASQACHGAIKFNDSLTFDESCHLMASLSCCQLPFQCAHGRPSMLPLADVDHLQQENKPKPNLAKLRKMVKAWKLFGKEKESTVNVEASAVL
ncbi:DNA mismatch repair protein Mlh3 isoform X1 [Thamnophis elegans]|uniref:DNA mismatch repair protein Mlh3 isoform X1 n=1 Tax=Thamnophis elegans TaxID=35005 RepID=UPI001377542E|nr:DNA mismatch repair protein Mlh3 isoform X1 [Thamnophis elegans]XP_032087510.1 DNA mismatch repair protein Mlh3 isoform X1 [Thamnophis elegans]XP_032087518.1 DNA mismatch repair protein Mlh3 isoform X1 [Thamnophis elegans]